MNLDDQDKEQTQSQQQEPVSLASRFFKKLGEWRPLGYFLVLLSIFLLAVWIFVIHHQAILDFIVSDEYWSFSEESPRIAFFGIVGALLRRLITLFGDSKMIRDDLPVYGVRVLTEAVYTPILVIILLYFLSTWHWIFEGYDISLATAGKFFTSVLAVVLGLFNPHLVSLVYKIFYELFKHVDKKG